MKRKRVLLVLGSLGAGGTERQVLEILRHLDRQTFEPILYLIYRTGELLPQVPADVPVISYWQDRPLPRFLWPGRILLSQTRHLRQVILAEAIDVVYDRASHVALNAGLATPSEVGRISAVVADPERDFANSHRRFPWLKKKLLRRSYLQADRIAAVSAGVRESIVEFYGIPAGRIVTCPNLFDFERIRQRALEDGPPFESGRFHIVCVGRLQREKGQRFLVEALRQLVAGGATNALLWLVGSGPDVAPLQKQVAEGGLEGHVRFEGFQSNPLPYMRQADVLCLPSLFEGMPNALVEALACGTPVIASDCPSGPREITQEGAFGRLVPPGDAAAMAAALQEAHQDASRALTASANPWRRRAEAGRQSVTAKYSWKTGIEILQKLLLEVAAEKNR